jgi:formate/nitrite transporter FocA (FNT family)
MYFIPVAMLIGAEAATVGALIANLVPVTVGNIVGGSIFVALVYWLIYIRGQR